MSHSDKPLLRALQGHIDPYPPVWLMRQAGRYLPEYRALRAEAGSFLGLCYDPEKAAEVTLQPLARFQFDAAILFSDILIICQALGQKIGFQEGEGPKLSPIRTKHDLDHLSLEDLSDRLSPIYQTVRRVHASLPPKTALIGFAGAPWTVATYMVEGGSSRDFLQVKAMAYGEPALFARLIDLLVEATTDYLVGQIDHGAEIIKLFDSWAGALPEDQFQQWVINPTKAIVKKLRAKRPGIPIIGFPKGAGALYRPFVEQTEVDAIALDTAVPLHWAVETLAPLACLQGNLDPVLLIAGGDALDHAIDRIRTACREVPFIFNLGHGILPMTPPDNVAQLVARLRRSP